MSIALTPDRVSEITAIDDITSADQSPDPNSHLNGSKPGVEGEKLDVVQNEKLQRKGDRPDGKHELQQEEVMDQLPYTWTPKKKWTVLSVIFVVQCSMNCTSAISVDHESTNGGSPG